MSISTKLADFKAFIGRAWALAVPYFQSEEKWKARGLLAAIIALNLGFVYTLVLVFLGYTGLGISDTVYAQLVDNTTGLVLSNVVTPIPVKLDGRTRTVSLPMEDVVYTIDAGDSLTLQITSSALNYFDAWSYGGITISDITLDLPLHDRNS